MRFVDDLAVINGIRPAVLLADEETREIGSKTSKSVYKVKRTLGHYYWYVLTSHPPPFPPLPPHTSSFRPPLFLSSPFAQIEPPAKKFHLSHSSCPAWRNQKGVESHARTCKHIKELLGEAYEEARLARVAAGGASTTPASKAKPKPASKAKPESKANLPAGKAKPASKAQGKAKAEAPVKAGVKRKKVESDIEEEDEVEDDADEAEGEGMDVDADIGAGGEVDADPNGTFSWLTLYPLKEDRGTYGVTDVDELAVINGIRPSVLLADEETREVGSKTSKSVYKVKRTLGHYYCTCPVSAFLLPFSPSPLPSPFTIPTIPPTVQSSLQSSLLPNHRKSRTKLTHRPAF